MGLGDAYLADELREIFGLIRETHANVIELGVQMATAAEQINALGVKIDDIAADFEALRDAMEAERENLSPTGQAALDAASAKLDALNVSVGDADGSDTPPVP